MPRASLSVSWTVDETLFVLFHWSHEYSSPFWVRVRQMGSALPRSDLVPHGMVALPRWCCDDIAAAASVIRIVLVLPRQVLQEPGIISPACLVKLGETVAATFVGPLATGVLRTATNKHPSSLSVGGSSRVGSEPPRCPSSYLRDGCRASAICGMPGYGLIECGARS